MDWSDDGSIEEHVGNEHVPEYLEQFLRSRGMKQRASGYSKRRIRLFYGLEEENPNPDEPDEDEESSLNESDEDDEDEVVLRNGSLSRYNTLLDTDGLEVGELVVDGESPVITDLNEQNEQNEQNEPMNERTNEPTNEPTNQQRNERRRGQTDEEVNELMNSPGFLPWVDLAPETMDRLLSTKMTKTTTMTKMTTTVIWMMRNSIWRNWKKSMMPMLVTVIWPTLLQPCFWIFSTPNRASCTSQKPPLKLSNDSEVEPSV